MEIVKGQTVEVGFGYYDVESEEVVDGWSQYLSIDVDVVKESELIKIFESEDNILYVQTVTDAHGIRMGEEVLFSSLLV